MANTQKGSVPEKIINSPDPLGVRDANYQAETHQPKAYMIKDEKMPNVTLEVGKSKGVEGSAPSSSGTSLQKPVDSPAANPDQNLRQQFVSTKIEK